ncbi:MAG: hypothetical protein ACYTHJ_15910 [Planctomycetota bacterium]|jgi:hypothetical protein
MSVWEDRPAKNIAAEKFLSKKNRPVPIGGTGRFKYYSHFVRIDQASPVDATIVAIDRGNPGS